MILPGGNISRYAGAALAGVLLLFGGFVAGIISTPHLANQVSDQARRSRLAPTGDAPAEVRKGVLDALGAFQQGYTARDPKRVGEFMQRLFPESDEILLWGTNPGEWVRGRSRIAHFIQSDWKRWGDVRLVVDDAVVSSAGDVAWVNTIGTVNFPNPRPIRFSGVLTRKGETWLFRQVHFQWDESEPRASDLLRWKNLSQLLSWAIRSVVPG